MLRDAVQVLARTLPCAHRTRLPLEDFPANDIICLSASLFSRATLAATYRKKVGDTQVCQEIKEQQTVTIMQHIFFKRPANAYSIPAQWGLLFASEHTLSLSLQLI